MARRPRRADRRSRGRQVMEEAPRDPQGSLGTPANQSRPTISPSSRCHHRWRRPTRSQNEEREISSSILIDIAQPSVSGNGGERGVLQMLPPVEAPLPTRRLPRGGPSVAERFHRWKRLTTRGGLLLRLALAGPRYMRQRQRCARRAHHRVDLRAVGDMLDGCS